MSWNRLLRKALNVPSLSILEERAEKHPSQRKTLYWERAAEYRES